MVSAKPTLKYKVREPDAREPDREGGRYTEYIIEKKGLMRHNKA